jgi:glycosyltransferase involved in cell wall biosynthesis
MQPLSISELPSPPRDRSGWPWIEGEALASHNGQASDSKSPRISIVMPSLNQAPFIEEAIRSVLLQGYRDLEFIIVDGGSTDGTVDIIKKYEPWLSFWISESDKGQADALCKGFDRSTGDILAWLNSDDVYCEGALKTVASGYQQESEAGLFYGDCEIIDEYGVVIDTIKGESADLKRLMTRNVLSQPSTFFSRKALEKVGGINKDLHFIMDYELWLRMMLQGVRSCYIPQLFSRFRWYRISKSGSYSTGFGYEYLALLEKLTDDHGDLISDMTRLKAFHYAFTMIMACNKQGADDKDISKAIELWIQHLDRYLEEYRSDSRLWGDSLYRIGNAYCLQGDVKTGRSYFTRSLAVSRRFDNLSYPGWIASCFGGYTYTQYTAMLNAVLSFIRKYR